MKKQNKEIKEIENSKILVRKVLEKWKEEDGQLYMRTVWEQIQEPINLGSVAKPNEKIIVVKIDVPREKPKNNPFGMFFGQG